MKAVLDTNVLIDGALSHPGFQVAVASVSWAELEYGVRCAGTPVERARREARMTRLRELLGPGLAFDDDAAEAYGTVCGLVLGTGRGVRGRAVDLMIAATAVAHGSAVITRNPLDFLGLDGLLEVIAV